MSLILQIKPPASEMQGRLSSVTGTSGRIVCVSVSECVGGF